jgi:MFS family permease
MTTLAVTFYNVVVWLHISAVVVGFGGTFAYGVILAVAGKTSPRSIPGVLAGISANDRTVVTIGAIVVLLSGLYLAADSDQFDEFFVAWGIIAVLGLIALTHGYFLPNERKAKDAAERDIERAGAGEVEFGPEFNAKSSGLAKVGTATGLIVILTIYVMAAKPFL